MTNRMTRREVLQGIGATAAGFVLRIDPEAAEQRLSIGGRSVELRVTSISPNTVRVVVAPAGASTTSLNADGALVSLHELRTLRGPSPVKLGEMTVTPSTSPLSVRVEIGRAHV